MLHYSSHSQIQPFTCCVFPTTYIHGKLHKLHTVPNMSKYIYTDVTVRPNNPNYFFMISFQRKLREKHASFNVFKCITCLSVDFPSYTTHIKQFQSFYLNSKLLSNLENTTLNLSPPQKLLLWAEISQDLGHRSSGGYWVHLWCCPSADCTISRSYKGAAVPPARLVVCLQWVNGISWLSVFSELIVFESFYAFPPVHVNTMLVIQGVYLLRILWMVRCTGVCIPGEQRALSTFSNLHSGLLVYTLITECSSKAQRGDWHSWILSTVHCERAGSCSVVNWMKSQKAGDHLTLEWGTFCTVMRPRLPKCNRRVTVVSEQRIKADQRL